MNLTLSIHDQTLERARANAAAMGKSVNQLVREYLERLAELDDPERDVAELYALSDEAGGHSRGWRFDRDAIHERAG